MSEGPDLIPAVLLAAAMPTEFNLRIAAYKLEDAWAQRCENPASPPFDALELFAALATLHPGAACWIGMELENLLRRNVPPRQRRASSFRVWLEEHLKSVPTPEWAKPSG